MTDRYISTIFCDDIRHEVNGKMSLIGVYGGDLSVPSFPFTLNKFCISAKIVLRPGELQLPPMTLKISIGDQLIYSQDLDETMVPPANSSNGDSDQTEKRLVCQILMNLSPLELTEPGKLKVAVEIEDEDDIVGLSLKIHQTPITAES